ncbi:MAG: 50S ribosomal protein L10 [candidate division KSB1 bacterium]|nr:50S ribosomal protein L10 [candidate division KSB1 bacterium]
MPQPEKIAKVETITESLRKAKGVYITDFSGLTVEQMTQLRREFRKAQVGYLVVKNTLAERSCRELGMDSMIPFLKGPTGLAVAYGDPVAPVRIIVEFLKKNKEKGKPELKGALVEGQLLSAAQAEAMKDLPTREQLIAQVVGAIAAPLSGLAGTLNSLIGKFVGTLDAVREKKEA